MKRLKRFALATIIFFGCLHLLLVFTGYTHMYRAVWYNFPGIEDGAIFESRDIAKGDSDFTWHYDKVGQRPVSPKLDSLHAELQSVAFFVAQGNNVLHESYWDDYSQDSYSGSFSVAKTYIATLIGCAIQDGVIASVNDPVSKYIPEFKEGNRKSILLKHVLSMSTGLNWDESYQGPISLTTKAYYGTNLKELALSLESIEEPGQAFKYQSIDTQILAIILENATGKNVSDYMSEKIWKPLGCHKSAYWNLDHEDGLEKAYCCINSNAPDFAQLGRLYLANGKIDGVQIIDSAFAMEAISPYDYQKQKSDHYGYQWWLLNDYKGHDYFYARGILGQYIICSKETDLIIVRLGHIRGEKSDGLHPDDLFMYIDEANTMIHGQ